MANVIFLTLLLLGNDVVAKRLSENMEDLSPTMLKLEKKSPFGKDSVQGEQLLPRHQNTVEPSSTAIRETKEVIKIACIGDSQTAGFPFDSNRGSDPEVSGYPWHLARLLGGSDGFYKVRNFGKGETTVVSGSKSYDSPWYLPQLQQALEFKPNKVLLMFGANDVKQNRLQKLETEFESRYTKLIHMFSHLTPTPDIYVMIPPPMYDNNIYGPEFTPAGGAGGMQQMVYNDQLPKKLTQLAERAQAHMIDIRRAFLLHPTCEDVTRNCCDWETRKPPKRNDPRTNDEIEANQCFAHDDAIHPNDEGYKNIASMVKSALIDEISSTFAEKPVVDKVQHSVAMGKSFSSMATLFSVWLLLHHFTMWAMWDDMAEE